jgi:uncharacterized protein
MKFFLRSCLTLLGAITLWQVSRGVRSAWSEYNVFHVSRTAPAPPAGSHERGLRIVEFPGEPGTTIRGWYVPSRTGAAVVLAAGSESDRSAMWPYAELLSDGGTGVLLFDWPGCGESDGRVMMGEPERVALQNGISFVLAQPDVHHGRVGVIGFSLGSYISVLEAARDPRARLLVLEGLFDDPWSQTAAEYAPAGVVAKLGAKLADYAAGLRPDAPRVTGMLPNVHVREVLFVAGDRDRTVPIAISRALYEAAAQPKDFWLIRGASHGQYLTVDAEYGPRLRALIERTLAEPGDTALGHR